MVWFVHLFEIGEDRYRGCPDNPTEESLSPGFNQRRLALAVAVIAMMLPITLLLRVVTGGAFHDAISHFYYSPFFGREVFTGSLMALAAILIGYQADDPKEARLATIAGLLAILIAIFPTDGWAGVGLENQCPAAPVEAGIDGGNEGIELFGDDLSTYTVFGMSIVSVSSLIHSSAAGAMFALLAFFSYFVFTRELFDGHAQLAAKSKRNRVYRICGIIIAVCIVIIGAFNVLESDVISAEPFWDCWNSLFWVEAIALWAFGFSWLVKSKHIWQSWVDDPKLIAKGLKIQAEKGGCAQDPEEVV